MKKVGLVTWMVILAAVVSAFSVLTIEADDVRGTYWNSEKTAHIRIYRAKDGLYYGKIDKLVAEISRLAVPLQNQNKFFDNFI
ncbi:hypothetical protein N9F53_00950 [Bacteroidia bacterium]|nr:hypothetical protein [Bacteroidia bacterium]